MTSPSKNHHFLVVCLIAILFLCPCYARIPTNYLKVVCSQTKYPNLCLRTIGSDPHAAKADYVGLAKIALAQTISLAKKNIGGISSTLARNRDPQVRQSLLNCTESYDLSVIVSEHQINNVDYYKDVQRANENIRWFIGLAAMYIENRQGCLVKIPYLLPTWNENFVKQAQISDKVLILLLTSV